MNTALNLQTWNTACAWMLAFALACSALIGCGDSQLTRQSVAPNNGTTTSETPETSVPTTSGTTTTTNTTPTDTTPTPDGCCIMIPIGGENSFDVPQFGRTFLGVYVYDRQTGSPVVGELVEFEMEGQGDANLSQLSIETDDRGQALVQFFAGEDMIEYSLTARHSGASDVSFTVGVGQLPSGSLKVNYINAGESVYTVAPLEVYLFKRSQFVCNNFRPQSGVPEPLYQETLPNTDQTSQFDGLTLEEPWTLVAFGMGEFGQVAAAGCLSNINVVEDRVTEIDMVMTLLALNPVGRYRVTSNWDFTETLEDSGNVGQILLQVFDAFENPGRYIFEQIIELVRLFLGQIITSALDFFLDVFGLDDAIEDGINNFISGNDFLSRIQQAGLDLRDMVTNLEVISTLSIGKLGSDYGITGSDDWLGLAVYWRWNCTENDPDDCGRIELALDPDSSLGLVFGEWRGQVTAYNQLQIFPHTVNLHYGRLIVYLLNEIVLPFLTDGQANNMTDAILYWINCQGLAQSITGSDGEICAPARVFCIQDDSIASVCESTIRSVFGFAEVLLEDLEVESVMELSGEAKLVERDGDLLVDEIIEGTYDGTINIQSSRSPFSATWSAERLEVGSE